MTSIFLFLKRHFFTLVFAFIIIASIAIIGVAIIADPFSLPFQDWDSMPEQQKQMYIQLSEDCTSLLYFGLFGLFLGLLGSMFNIIKKSKRPAKNKT